MKLLTPKSLVVIPLALLALLASKGALAAERQQTFELDLRSGQALKVENLVGRMTVSQGSGDVAVIRATVVAESDALAQSIEFNLTESSGRNSLEVVYPKQHSSLFYSTEGHRYNTSTKYQGRKFHITSSSNRDATDLHVNLDIALPADTGTARLINHVGSVELTAVSGNVDVDSGAGTVSSVDGKGRLRADTGSGSVKVVGHRGEVRADTGSGSVVFEQIQGNVGADTGSGTVHISGISGSADVDTGSGSVTLEDVIGDMIEADTGSGSVTAKGIRGRFSADTGSGSVKVSELSDCEALDIDTGSGRVVVQGDLSALERMRIDTGSGSVLVKATQIPSMRLSVKVRSGNIDIDVPDLQGVRKSGNKFEAQLGSGRGVGVIDTGSGSVKFSLVD